MIRLKLWNEINQWHKDLNILINICIMRSWRPSHIELIEIIVKIAFHCIAHYGRLMLMNLQHKKEQKQTLLIISLLMAIQMLF